MAMNRAFEALQGRLSGILDSTPAQEIERNAKAILGGAFSRLDLITREEFEIQARLLQRTQEQLAAVTARLARLEGLAPAAPVPGTPGTPGTHEAPATSGDPAGR